MTAQSTILPSRLVGRILLGLIALGLVAFIVLQLVPVRRDNPPITGEPQWDSPQTHELAKRACFDCHSNETVWPWYSYVAPVSWLVSRDVQEARDAFNFSEWGGGEGDIAEEMAEEIGEGEMPPTKYLVLHPEARLSDTEKQRLVDGLQASLGQ